MRRRAEEERRRRENEFIRRQALAREAKIRAQKKALKEKMRARRKAERKRKRKIFFGRLAVGSVIFLILAVIAASFCTFLFLRAPDAPGSSKVTYSYGGKKVRTASGGLAFRNGVLYLCFNDVADYLGMAVTGSASEMKFIFPKWDEAADSSGVGDEEYVIFRNGSRSVSFGSRTVTAESDCVLVGENVWVPAQFAEDNLDGVEMSYSAKDRTLKVDRLKDEENSTKKETVYLPVSLKLKEQTPLKGYLPGNAVVVPAVSFVADLSSYETYMDPPDAAEYLITVNASEPLSPSFVPTDLNDLPMTRLDGRATQKARLFPAKALEAMFAEMAATGHTDVTVTSGYRSYGDQTALFEGYVSDELAADPSITREEAEWRAASYSSRPGVSEHQTGLAVDMHNLAYASAEFAETDSFKWLSDNAWKFGFILRYPEGKSDITGKNYEPWHWRYVGRTAAYAIKEQGLCLEEYGK